MSAGRHLCAALLLLVRALEVDAVPVVDYAPGPRHASLGQGLGLNASDPWLPAGRIDTALRMAPEAPTEALRALAELQTEWTADPPPEATSPTVRSGRSRLLARARLQVRVEARELEALRSELEDSPPPPLALSPEAADHALMRAQLAELEQRPGPAAEQARAALAIYRVSCPLPAELEVDSVTDEAAPTSRRRRVLQSFPDCDYRSVWQAERILERQAMAAGVWPQVQASAHWRLALALAAEDVYRSAQTWSLLAYVSAVSGAPRAQVEAQLGRARDNAEQSGNVDLRLRTLVNEAAVASLAGDAGTAVARTRSALVLARTAGLERPQPMLLNNLADAQLRLRQPRQALRTVEQALPMAERLGDRRTLHALYNNAGLARIGLGLVEAGKRDMQRAEALLGGESGDGQRLGMLREFGEALAAAGDARAALDLYHRERALSARISQANLDAALREIQSSFDAEVRQRDLALLQDEVATREDELASQDLVLRIWLLLLALLALLLLLAGLVHRQLRGRERLLNQRRERLRRESELDPLTGLGNRRALEARMRNRDNAARAPGALLLLDVDHFKQINDRHGHASGDRVLVEVARRIQSCLRRDDLVVRWGGEEFLLHADGMAADAALLLARRILERMVEAPFELPSGPLQVSASIGLCLDRLPGIACEQSWQARLRLADLALYAAKSRGRSRAVAVLDCRVGDAAGGEEIDFEAAERAGQLRTQTAVVNPGG